MDTITILPTRVALRGVGIARSIFLSGSVLFVPLYIYVKSGRLLTTLERMSYLKTVRLMRWQDSSQSRSSRGERPAIISVEMVAVAHHERFALALEEHATPAHRLKHEG
jgi:hypothetical protein